MVASWWRVVRVTVCVCVCVCVCVSVGRSSSVCGGGLWWGGEEEWGRGERWRRMVGWGSVEAEVGWGRSGWGGGG